MQITLVRHGRPDHTAASWCTPAQMKGWIANYNQADVIAHELPDGLGLLAEKTGVVVCSSLSRCVQSRGHLACDCRQEPDPLFAEAHLPYPDWSFPPMPSRLWRLLFRGAWFFGFARHTEPISESNRRASAAAERLIELAEAHGSVLLMGHGIMNILIARQLRKRGWAGPPNLVLKRYWEPCSYYKED
ncbi:histidine phosphatase family protein [Pseudomonas stutzeri]|uniref:histidine phosphatase family protein n=1 Tax=Stutzerimonas stutzeri TaxID=316 RepID=UPI0021098D9A|nr:histidine phosphatase family protein [Stutzerimonas stutzeri]MCQ4286551.1 histidine phosphatase family protein [Stutzerimonas stutzeri]